MDWTSFDGMLVRGRKTLSGESWRCRVGAKTREQGGNIVDGKSTNNFNSLQLETKRRTLEIHLLSASPNESAFLHSSNSPARAVPHEASHQPQPIASFNGASHTNSRSSISSARRHDGKGNYHELPCELASVRKSDGRTGKACGECLGWRGCGVRRAVGLRR